MLFLVRPFDTGRFMRSNRFLLLAGALATATLLSGCGSTPGGAAKPTAVPTATVTDPVGASAIGSPSATTTPDTVSAGAVDPNAPEVHEVGDIPDNQVFIPYTTSTGLYSLSYPEGWSRTGDGDAVSFTDKLNAIDVAVVVKTVAPTVGSVNAIDLAAIAAKSSNFTARKVSTVTRKGGDALLATYEIDSAPNAVTGKALRVAVERYEFWKNGRSVVVTLIGAVGADNVDPWKIVTDSFHWAP